MSEQQLVLAPAEPTVEVEVVDGAIADEPADVAVIAAPAPAGPEQRNLFGEAERIAARAASASTRRQYGSIFRAFGDWLASELGRPPVVGDLDTDAIAAYASGGPLLERCQVTRRRLVRRALSIDERRCLYCLASDESFTKEEHVIPRALGPATEQYVLRPGRVCDECNVWLGRQVDAPFVHRYDIALSRALEGLTSRSGPIEELDCVDPTRRLDVEIKPGIRVAMFVNNFEQTRNGGFRVRFEPSVKDPPDIVARTMRALWKIALGIMRGGIGRDYALDPRWDDLRDAVLGGPFSGYLIQAPFRAIATGKMKVNINPNDPEAPTAVTLQIGGVLLAAPLDVNRLRPPESQRLQSEGWTVMTTNDSPPREFEFELVPSRPSS